MANIVYAFVLGVPTVIAMVILWGVVAASLERSINRDGDMALHRRLSAISLAVAAVLVAGGWYVLMNMDRWSQEAASRRLEKTPPTPTYYTPRTSTPVTDESSGDYSDGDLGDCGYGGWGC